MQHPARFPTTRLRRTRRHAWLRDAVAETTLSPADLVWPLFVHEAPRAAAVPSMPGVERLAIEGVVRAAEEAARLGIPAIALFPVVDAALKTDDGRLASDPENLACQTVRAVRAAFGDALGIICDVALDPYTTHGHDGILLPDGETVANDETVGVLTRMAVLHAQAGVDFVAPSDMMDGRVGAIRRSMDAAGCTHTAIMAYSAKFASAYYGPFRDAVGSAQAAGTHSLDKRGYQVSPGNRREALIEAALDEAEGADVLMVKPAGPYLDIIREIRNATQRPVAAYQVSGEYAQLKAASERGWLDLARTRRESLLAIKRAGADMILTYFAKEMATELAL
jgi:porphobilinogen synthase